jgi:hypothetical protein
MHARVTMSYGSPNNHTTACVCPLSHASRSAALSFAVASGGVTCGSSARATSTYPPAHAAANATDRATRVWLFHTCGCCSRHATASTCPPEAASHM